ncbi:MAG: bile acid:sodium symporter [Planctomycetaceae bacterium]
MSGRLAASLRKRWLLDGLIIAIAGGLSLGPTLVSAVPQLTMLIEPRAITAIILFLMSASLDNQRLRNAFRRPAPVCWAIGVNAGIVPLLALALKPIQMTYDYQVGLMLAASVPCTMAAASVWTRKAGGNDAVSLLVTVATNGLCFVSTPFWLNWATPDAVNLTVSDMMTRLLTAVLLPMALGQLLRISSTLSAAADRHKTSIGVVAQSLILCLVFLSSCKAGLRIEAGTSSVEPIATAIVWASCIAIHLLAMGIAVFGARCMRFTHEDLIAVAFSSSQKTLPIGVLLAGMMGDAAPFAVFPMLMFHASQLFIDTAVADRFASGQRPAQSP